MKRRAVPVLVGAFAVALLVVAAGAATGVRIPNGTIGLKKLTPGLRKLVKAGGPQGPAGPTGAPGIAGPAGAAGRDGKDASGSLFTYSFLDSGPPSEIIQPPHPLVLTREGGSTQESIGPLTFLASCVSEGEDTIRAKLEVTSDENGVILNGSSLNAGVTRTLQEPKVSGGGSEEALLVVRATNEGGTFALQGVASAVVGLPDGCHFFGTLIEDS